MKMIYYKVALLSLVANVVISAERNDCPHGWVDGSFVEMGCIMLNANSSMTLEEANEYCYSSHNASLVELRMPEQLEFVRMELEMLEEHEGGKDWWTSGTDVGREGQWYWASSLAPVHDFVWSSGNTVSGITQNCLALLDSSTANENYMGYDRPCTDSGFPLCQIKCQ